MPLLADIQRRWQLAKNVSDSSGVSEMPLAWSSSYAKLPISEAQENSFTVQRKISSPQEKPFQTQSMDIRHVDGSRTINWSVSDPTQPTGKAEEKSTLLQGSAPTSNYELGTPLLQRHQNTSVIQQFTPIHTKVIETEQSDGRMLARARMTPLDDKTDSPQDIISTGNNEFGVNLLQRHIGISLTRKIQPSNKPQGHIAPLDKQVTGHTGDLNLSHAISKHSTPDSLQDFPIIQTDIAIQRTSLGNSKNPSDTITSPMPLARPLQISMGRSEPGRLIQTRMSTSTSYNQIPRTNWIQRQSQADETTVMAESSTSTTSVASAPIAEEPSQVGAVDIDIITEKVIRTILLRMAVERERYGIGRWH